MKTFSLRIFLALALLLPLFASAQEGSTGDIKVTVLDETQQAMPGAVVSVIAGGPRIGGQTDMNGNYTFRALAPGSYDIEARMVNYKRFVKTQVLVSAGQTAYVSFPMQVIINDSSVITIVAERGPIDKTFSTIQNISATEVKRSPNRNNVALMVSGSNSQVSEGKNGGLVMRGSRENASAVYVDGEKMYGANGVPAGSIDGVTVLSGGIPASFGDVTGGIVIITTKSYYSGIAYKQAMYEAAAAERAAAQKAADEASGKRKETTNEITERQDSSAQQPAPAPAPAGQQPAPGDDQPAPQPPAPKAPMKNE